MGVANNADFHVHVVILTRLIPYIVPWT